MGDRLETLSDALLDAAFTRTLAEEAARAAYPAGAEVIVRTQRHGYPAREHRGVVTHSAVEVCSGFTNTSLAYVVLNVRNTATGKVSKRYPGSEVDGMPEVRLADDRHRGDSRGGEGS